MTESKEVQVVESGPHAPAVYAPSLARPIAKPHELIEYHKEMTALIEGALTPNVDFGVIPGTEKPTLLKPGAERLGLAFGAVPRFEVIEQEIDHNKEIQWNKRQKVWNNKFKGDRTFTWQDNQGTSLGLYRYVLRCRMERADGRILGEGVGSCSSLESKYIDRPRDLENTILKMAKKRAHVDACLTAFGLSNRFTQDVEDMPKPEPTAPPPASAPPPGGTRPPAATTAPAPTGEHKLEHERKADDEKALHERNDAIKTFLATVDEFEDLGGHAKTTLKMDAVDVIKMPAARVRAATKLLRDEIAGALKEKGVQA